MEFTADPEIENADQPEETVVEDESESDKVVAHTRYDITGYGIDFDVDGLVKRINNKDVFIPEFQRDYVWNIGEASRFVESLLLGLPVPGIFLAKEEATGKLLVIDGQQRLKTLQFFYGGTFKPNPDDKIRRVFRLLKVQKQYEGLTYDKLEERDRINLGNSVIHATVIKQDSPPEDDTSIYHIFERLNSGGKLLTAQEIRCVIYHGNLIDALKIMNDNPSWRGIFGKKSPRQKDQELILRFLAMYYNASAYTRPMADFLNIFASKRRNADPEFLKEAATIFDYTIEAFYEALGAKAFRPVRALNTAVFDSMMVGLARRIAGIGKPTKEKILEVYSSLLRDEKYLETVSRSTADDAFVATRLQKATDLFVGI